MDSSIRKSAVQGHQLRTVLVMFLLLAIVIIRPALSTAWYLLFPQEPAVIQGETFRAPTGWLARWSGAQFQVWKPCLTILCRSVSDSIKIGRAEKKQDASLWRSAAEEALPERGYDNPKDRNVGDGSRRFGCLESVKVHDRKWGVSACYNSALNIMATFEGRSDNIGVFYRMIEGTNVK